MGDNLLYALQSELAGKADDVASPSWTAPTLLNSWVNFGSPYNTAGYYKDQFGVVRLRGRIASGTTTGGTVLMTLPSGFRPSADWIFPALTNDLLLRIDVQSDGDVVIQTTANAAYISLDGISFTV